MRLVVRFLIGICLVVSAAVIWFWPGMYSFWLRIAASGLALVAMVLAALAADVMLVAAGFEGKSRWSSGRTKESVRVVIGCGLYAMVLVAAVAAVRRYELSPAPVADQGALTARLEAAIEASRNRSREAAVARRGLEEERDTLVARMRDIGFRSAADASRSETHARMAGELQDLHAQIQALKAVEKRHATLIERIENSLRQAGRERWMATAAESAAEVAEIEASLSTFGMTSQQGRGSRLLGDIELNLLLDDTFAGVEASSAPRSPDSTSTE